MSAEPIPFIDDDDDWIELERAVPGKVLPDVSLRLGKQPRTGRIAAYLTLRGEAGAHLIAHGPRFRVMIGGSEADRVKIVPDAQAGRYEVIEFKGVARLWLGVVTVWPAENRDAVACEWRRDGMTMSLLLKLPSGFTRPTKAPVLSLPAPAKPVEDKQPALVAKVVAERDELAERLRQIEEERDSTFGKIPDRIGDHRLPKLERSMLAVLIARDVATKEALLHASAVDGGDDDRDPKIVDVIICKLRPKLAAIGIEIKTHWGDGYSIPRQQRKALKKMFGMPAAELERAS